jgi:hypothetical protein
LYQLAALGEGDSTGTARKMSSGAAAAAVRSPITDGVIERHQYGVQLHVFFSLKSLRWSPGSGSMPAHCALRIFKAMISCGTVFTVNE